MTPPPGLTFRPMRVADIPAGLALCRASRWNQVDRDWRHFLEVSPNAATVAVIDGRVVGTVALRPYGPFTWISMVLVDPTVRGRGIGTQLLERGLAAIPTSVCARLDATPAGQVIYDKLGFVPEYGLARWFRDTGRGHERPPTSTSSPGRTRPLVEADWRFVRALDAKAFGASRADLLSHLAVGAPEYAFVSEHDGRIEGFLFGRHGHVREHLGPLVADSDATASALLAEALAAVGARGVFVDVPDAQAAWRGVLASLGFSIERPFLRMRRGPLADTGLLSAVFAMAGPELG